MNEFGPGRGRVVGRSSLVVRGSQDHCLGSHLRPRNASADGPLSARSFKVKDLEGIRKVVFDSKGLATKVFRNQRLTCSSQDNPNRSRSFGSQKARASG